MREIRTSGLMSGDGKRSDADMAQATAPVLDSTLCFGLLGYQRVALDERGEHGRDQGPPLQGVLGCDPVGGRTRIDQ